MKINTLFVFILFSTSLFSQNLLPQFPGGEKALFNFLEEELVYPPEALENEIGGIITVCFVVNENGRVKEVKATNAQFDYPRKNREPKPDIEEKLIAEAERGVMTMPVWQPEMVEGKPMASLCGIRIRFNNKTKFFDFDFAYTEYDKTRFYNIEVNRSPNLGSEIRVIDVSRSKQIFKILEPDIENLTAGYELPRFIGKEGNMETYFTKRYTYPLAAREYSLSADILAGFTIDKNGFVTNAKIINARIFLPDGRPISDAIMESEFRKEMIRIINKMPRWIPATLHSEFVETHFVIEMNVIL